jgi:hypothetical protein
VARVAENLVRLVAQVSPDLMPTSREDARPQQAQARELRDFHEGGARGLRSSIFAAQRAVHFERGARRAADEHEVFLQGFRRLETLL